VLIPDIVNTRVDATNVSKESIVFIADNYTYLSERDSVVINNIQDTVLKNKVKEWLGTPYKYGGCSKDGIDCSCFTRTLLKEVYDVDLGRSSRDMYNHIKPLSKKNNLKEGDLVFFKINKGKISHVGIYLSDGNFIHSSTSLGVIINNLSENYYLKHYFKGGRFLLNLDNQSMN